MGRAGLTPYTPGRMTRIDPRRTPSAELPRTIGFWGATGVMVGVMIGSGIFRSPPVIAGAMETPWLILVLWAAGGVLALCGALTYAELASMHPHTGGVYVFLREAYGRGVAFVFGWTYLLLSKPFAGAGLAVVFAGHLNDALGVSWDHRVVASIELVVLTVLNTFGLRLGSGVAGLLTAIKAAALVAIVLLGARLLLGDAGAAPSAPSATEPLEQAAPAVALAMVMSQIMWTYDGWGDVGAIAGEIRDPQRNLPRTYLVGTAAVTLLYVAVNAVYMRVVPLA